MAEYKRVPWKAEKRDHIKLKDRVTLSQHLLGPCDVLGTMGHTTLRTGSVSDLSLHAQQHLTWWEHVAGRQEMSVGGMTILRALSSIISLKVVMRTGWQDHCLCCFFLLCLLLSSVLCP